MLSFLLDAELLPIDSVLLKNLLKPQTPPLLPTKTNMLSLKQTLRVAPRTLSAVNVVSNDMSKRTFFTKMAYKGESHCVRCVHRAKRAVFDENL